MWLMALIVACIAWTVTNEEVFREFREWLRERHHYSVTVTGDPYRTHREEARPLWQRKLLYLPTCQYCFSHWVAAGVLLISPYRLWPGVLGYVLTTFVVVALANVLMTAYELFRQLVRLIRLHGHNIERHIQPSRRAS